MTLRTALVAGLIAVGGGVVLMDAQAGFPRTNVPDGGGAGFPGGRTIPGDPPGSERRQEPLVFRGGVTLVQFDAFVTDAQGNPVKGLKADDFEVFEGGNPRAVSTFAAIDIPIDPPVGLPVADTAEPDVQTNERPEGRTYLIALDEVSPDRTLRARNFVRRFIADHMGPNDVAAVALTGRGLASSGQDFTSNRRLILTAVDKFSGGFEESTPNVVQLPITAGTTSVQGPAEDKAFSSDPRQLAASLRTQTEFLATLPGRKTLLFVAEGLAAINFFEVLDYKGGALGQAAVDAHEAVAAATRGNVTIYPVDPRGLTTDLTPAGALESKILENRADLVALAEVTGGFAVTNTNNLDAAYARIVRENSTYYTIGFNSEYARRDGRFVRIDVRVKRPGLQVRARSGFVAPLESERRPKAVEGVARFPAVKDALASATSTRGLPIRVFAAPYKLAGDRSRIALAVEIEVSPLDFQKETDARTSSLEVSYVATDATGKIHPGRRHTANLAINGDASKGSEQNVRILSEFELPDGRYQLRVAAGSTAKAGSVLYDLEVPDFTKGPLAMSGVSLTSAAAGAVTTLKPNDPLADVLPAPFTSTREFSGDDEIVLFAEVYDNRQAGRNAAPDPIEFKTAITSERGRIIRLSHPESRAAAAPKRKSGGHGFTVRLPLEGLEPGPYVLLVEAHSGGAEGPKVTRRIPILVR
jgi:VWFA-related protein